jgi:hypothetical protein
MRRTIRTVRISLTINAQGQSSKRMIPIPSNIHKILCLAANVGFPVASIDPNSYLLQENGDFLLQENGDKFIL